jgi:hypothetical protein
MYARFMQNKRKKEWQLATKPEKNSMKRREKSRKIVRG